jgi:hypothetical protein
MTQEAVEPVTDDAAIEEASAPESDAPAAIDAPTNPAAAPPARSAGHDFPETCTPTGLGCAFRRSRAAKPIDGGQLFRLIAGSCGGRQFGSRRHSLVVAL